MIGKTILHYKILEKLGEGGMGVVYKAEDTKLKREVALKFLPSHLTRDQEAKARFITEAQAASALDHQNICTVHQIDETGDGQMYIVMAYYEGITLRRFMETPDFASLPLERILKIAAQIAAGLAQAHEAGIIHRDIKPSNIMITGRGDVKILDFGIARVAGHQTITKTGSTLGTVAYMSPEQIKGEPVDERTDIWSVGVVMYEMITGQRPFHGEYDQAVMFSIVNEPHNSLSALRNDVPEELVQIIDKALAKNPEDRYQNVESLLNDLRDDSPADARRHIPKFTPPKRRTRALLGVALFLTIFVLGIVVYSFLSTKVESSTRIPIAVADFVNQTGEEELNGLSGMLVTSLEQSRRLRVLPRASMYGILSHLGKDSISTFDEPLVRQICAQAKVNTMAAATIHKFDNLYTIDLKILDLEQNRYLVTINERAEGRKNIPSMLDKIAEKIRRSLKERERDIVETNQPLAANTTTSLEAYQHYFQGMQMNYQGDHRGAQEQFEQAIALDSTFGLAYVRLALLSGWESANVDFKHAVQKALKFRDRIPEKERYLLRAMNESLKQDTFVDALLTQIKVLTEMEMYYPDDADMLFMLGDAAFHTQQYRKALPYFQKSLQIEPKNANALLHLAETYRDLGNFAEMRKVSERLIGINRSRGYWLLGQALALSGNIQPGVDRLREEMARHPDDDFFAKALVSLYMLDSQFEEAEKVLNTLPTPTESQLAVGTVFNLRRVLYIYTGRYRKALNELDNWVNALIKAGSDSASIGTLYLLKGQIYNLGWGDRKSAWEQIEINRKYGNKPSMGIIYHQLVAGGPKVGSKIAEDSVDVYLANADKEWINPLKALVFASRGQCSEAIKTADIVLKSREFRHSFPFLYDLAFCYQKMGQSEKAIKALQRLQIKWQYDRRPFYYPKSFYGLGKIYEEQGDARRAIENYQKFLYLWKNAVEDLPDLIDARVRLAKLRGVPKK